jgi:hypothetical protein
MNFVIRHGHCGMRRIAGVVRGRAFGGRILAVPRRRGHRPRGRWPLQRGTRVPSKCITFSRPKGQNVGKFRPIELFVSVK